MRTSTVIAVLAVAGVCSVGLVACKTGTSKPKDAVWFGPGSAPNPMPNLPGIGVGMFTAAAPMMEARVGHTATVLSDGRVLVVGGRTADPFNDPNNITAESEVYDPPTDTWIQVSQIPGNAALNPNPGYMYDQTGTVPTIRQEHSATILQTGTVLISGGMGVDTVGPAGGLGALRTCYRFEPTNNTFVTEQSLLQARFFHLSILMVNGEALVAGGVNSFNGFPLPAAQTACLQTAEVFDTFNGWTAVAGPMGGGHTWGNLHQLQNDSYINNGVFIDTQAPQGAQVQGATVRNFQTGMIWPGGSQNGQFPGNNGELFDPTAAQALFQPGPGSQRELPPSGIILSGSASLASGDIFYAGGENLTAAQNIKNQGALFTTEIMRLQTRMMDPGPDIGSSQPPIQLPGTPPTTVPAPPFAVTECEVEEIGFTSDVMIIGGLDQGGAQVAFAEQYNYVNNIMIGPQPGNPPVQMMVPRNAHRLAKLPNAAILVIGGFDGTQMPPAPTNNCEIWSR